MFDTGLLKIYELAEVAEDGGMPTEKLLYQGMAFYGARTVSATRLYQARGADCRIDKLVRVPFDTAVKPDMYVILDDGPQFRVDAVAEVIVRRDVRAVELTLIKLEENLNVELAE